MNRIKSFQSFTLEHANTSTQSIHREIYGNEISSKPSGTKQQQYGEFFFPVKRVFDTPF